MPVIKLQHDFDMKSVLNDDRLFGAILANMTGKFNRKPLPKRGKFYNLIDKTDTVVELF